VIEKLPKKINNNEYPFKKNIFFKTEVRIPSSGSQNLKNTNLDSVYQEN
jgi:hypothetical protein